jgi:chromosome segregation ATPase
MKNIIIAILTSLLLFMASAGASIYLNQPAPESTDQDLATPPAEEDRLLLEPPVKEMANQMPVALRPDQALTIEAVQQMSESAEKRQKKLDEFEMQLKKEEQRVQLLFEDLKREKKELTSYSDGLQKKVEALDAMTVQLQQLLSKIESQKLELEKLETKTGVQTDKSNELQTKVDQVKGWFGGLEAQQAANILINKANQGDLEFAAMLLHSLQDRQKAKILGAVDDPALVNQLIDSLEIKRKKEK